MASLKDWSVGFEDAGTTGKKVVLPPGFLSSTSYEEAPKDRASNHNMLKKQQDALWARAQAPLKQVGMMCFMQWMMGNQAHLMTILMIGGIVYNYVSQIMQSGQMFKGTPELDATGPRLLFVGIQGAGLLFAIYKLNGMGLLPTHASDWFDAAVPEALEFSAGGQVLA
uniref:ER membrane protein complex subunit 4 n=1 Tax=Tetraselmis sp. GSL018 TaxID=582737 RepID=A0A061QUA2_9CHLO|mmetsp:Transcript_27209/g.64496  ORF Transcript_27209/g.64496 Transcript_27209/m.64496 type:complete len:168 (-) Transcript_27209:156-659(-)